MAQPVLIEVPLEAGGSLLVEADQELQAGTIRAGRPGEIVATARQTLEAALDQLKPLATAVLDRLRTIEHPPRQVDVEFGIKLTAQAGVVLAASSGEANLKVNLSWARQE